ncbi:MAG: hydrogenase maturation protease [Candidatus Krumholzibacteria bacterium]|nr:hydrogenase maturation protease [Candidatus Krumholzibacteria bacterium]
MKTIVLGLGNTILSDDGAGIYVARALGERIGGAADVREAELAGFDLIEILKGYDRAYIVDAIQLDGEEPGVVFRMKPDDIRITPRLASFHDIDIVTALALGRRLEFHMPDEIVIFGVQAGDTLTLGEQCTDAVKRVIPVLADEIAGEIRGTPHARISIELSARRNRGA